MFLPLKDLDEFAHFRVVRTGLTVQDHLTQLRIVLGVCSGRISLASAIAGPPCLLQRASQGLTVHCALRAFHTSSLGH